jgi:hypothetical protein
MKTEVEHDSLAVFREQVKAEKKSRGHMSETTVANFHAIKAQEKAAAVAAEKFKNAIAVVIVTPENLAKLIEKCEAVPADTGYTLGPSPEFKVTKIVRPIDQLARRVAKLSWWITAGYLLGGEIDSAYMDYLGRAVRREHGLIWLDDETKAPKLPMPYKPAPTFKPRKRKPQTRWYQDVAARAEANGLGISEQIEADKADRQGRSLRLI